MWEKIRKVLRENINGILGTIAFHLFLAVVFMLFKISSGKAEFESIIYLEFTDEPMPEEIIERTLEAEPEIAGAVEQLINESRRNIPVNVASRMDEEISTEKYVEQIEKELDASRSKEYYEQQERLKALSRTTEETGMQMDPGEDTTEEVVYHYEGPTTIWYSLKDRHHTRLPVPVYKCEEGGEITVTIAVDQRGRVTQVQIPDEGDSPNEKCLAEAARQSALASRFNADYEAPFRQQGSITYIFMAQ